MTSGVYASARMGGQVLNRDPLATFRVLVGAYAAVWLTVRMPAHLAHARQPGHRWDPVGVLTPLGSSLPDGAVTALAIVAPVLAVAFAAGWRYLVTAPLLAAVLLAVLTLDSSWGQIFHTENLLALHVLILAAAGPTPRSGWPLRLAALVVVTTYVAAGIAKLRIGGVDWVTGDVLRNLVAHDNLRKALLGDTYSPLGTAAVAHGWLFPPLAVATLAVELGAPLALVRRWRTAWVLAAWGFHVGVLALMAVVFPYQLFGVAFAPFVLDSTSAPASPVRADQPSGTQIVQSRSASTIGPAPP